MDGTKTKAILCSFLLVINLLLGLILIYRSWENNRIARRAEADSVAALAALGVEVSSELIFQEKSTLYLHEEERSLATQLETFKPLIGEGEPISQGGGIYLLETDKGKLRLSNSGAFELTLFDSTPALLELNKLVSAIGVEVDENMHQLLNGRPVFGHPLTLSVSPENDSDDIIFSGGLLLGEVYVSGETPSKSCVSALLSLASQLEDENINCSVIDSVQLGWSVELLAPDYTNIIPTWQIDTDVGTFYIDAISLELK